MYDGHNVRVVGDNTGQNTNIGQTPRSRIEIKFFYPEGIEPRPSGLKAETTDYLPTQSILIIPNN